MLSRTLAYIFSAACLCASFECFSQDSTATRPPRPKPDSVDRYKKFIPTGVRFGTDLVWLVKNQLKPEFNGWEVQADVDFYRYFLTVEYGSSKFTEQLRNGVYANDGSYLRVGVDVNFLYKDPVKNMFFIGGRFGRAEYSDTVSYSYRGLPFDPNNINDNNGFVLATWVELTTGIKVRIWKFFWMGATARFKFGLDLDGNGSLRSYEVPGFGRNIASTYWGFSYYAMFRIPFKPDPKPAKK